MAIMFWFDCSDEPALESGLGIEVSEHGFRAIEMTRGEYFRICSVDATIPLRRPFNDRFIPVRYQDRGCGFEWHKDICDAFACLFYYQQVFEGLDPRKPSIEAARKADEILHKLKEDACRWLCWVIDEGAQGNRSGHPGRRLSESDFEKYLAKLDGRTMICVESVL